MPFKCTCSYFTQFFFRSLRKTKSQPPVFHPFYPSLWVLVYWYPWRKFNFWSLEGSRIWEPWQICLWFWHFNPRKGSDLIWTLIGSWVFYRILLSLNIKQANNVPFSTQAINVFLFFLSFTNVHLSISCQNTLISYYFLLNFYSNLFKFH